MKDSFDIDDILEEVRKRRMENEQEVKNKPQNAIKKEENQPVNSDTPKNTKEKDEELKDNITEDFDEPKKENADNLVYSDDEPKEEKEVVPLEIDEEKIPDVPEENEIKEEIEPQEVDLLSLAEEANAEEKPKKPKWRTTKKGKITISVLVILLVLIFAGGFYAYEYVNGLLNKVTDTGEETSAQSLEEWDGMTTLVENFDPITEDSRANISSYQDMVKTWYYNGTPCSSTHVLNILLIGEDTREDDIAEEDTRADSAIIASINIDTGKIVLTSILRDSYAYWEITEGDKTTGQFGKINGAMSTGGVDCYIRCVENMFKVNIDNYAIVNFNSFEKIVDELGGVTINITSAEIYEINNHQSRYGNVTIEKDFEGTEGEMHLDGKQALAYCRIRKIDSDNARADRQKTVLLQIFDKMKSASTVKVASVVSQLSPYVKTGFSKTELVSIGKYAIKNGWLSYQTETHTVPENITNEDGTTTTMCKGGTYYGAWVWKVDYPLAAQEVQNNIYGKTSITLATYRPNFLTISEY